MPPINHHVTAQKYWRSLEELSGDPAALEAAGQEFVGTDPTDPASPSRRNFLKIMGASVALAGLTVQGCRRWPVEKLAPYSSNPRGRIPGNPEQYASAWEIGGVATGLLVTSYDGRPIKIEGNPSHPYSQTDRDPQTGLYRNGSADAFAQASVLELYDHYIDDPDSGRSQFVRKKGEAQDPSWDPTKGWDKFLQGMRDWLSEHGGSGEGMAILAEASAGPTLLEMRARLLKKYPKAVWYEYEPVSHDNLVEGIRLATATDPTDVKTGTPYRPVLHLDKAAAVLLIDSDVIGTHPAHTRYANDWVARRRQAIDDAKNVSMSRVYLAESTFSLTGSIADVRLGVKPDRLFAILAAVAAKLGVANAPSVDLSKEPALQGFVNSAAADLQKAGANALVSCGPTVSPAGHALAFAINSHLGGNGNTVTYVTDPVLDRSSHDESIRNITGRMFSQNIDMLVILGGNPVYDAPHSSKFAEVLASVTMSVHLSHYYNETSQTCAWHLPRAHYLESWSDARAWDGSLSIVQPLIEPIFGGKTPAELLAMLLNERDQAGQFLGGQDLVHRTWTEGTGIAGTQSKSNFRKALEQGVLDGSAWKTELPALSATSFGKVESPSDGYSVRFQADSRVYDGRFANNGWLQETPDNISKLVWDNAAMFSKADADKLGIETGDKVEIEVPAADFGGTKSAKVVIAAYILPGQPVGVIGLSLGYGRTCGHIATGLGFDAYAIRPGKNPGYVTNVNVSKTGETYELVMTQLHSMVAAEYPGPLAINERIGENKYESGRIVREGTFDEFQKDPRSVHGSPKTVELELFEPPLSFTGDKADPHAWGMAVDMSACIGCNACAVACQAENNIPIVGKFQCTKHREMNWIRIDRYFKGETDSPEVVYQPMLCQHCENAPCEQVCPVGATMHDAEGLNAMVYNRCIGTRYCSNNCPYKVRRFNFLDFHSQDPRETIPVPYLNIPDQQQLEQVDEIKRMVYNPDVSVRMRGVMEKCTFCVQRIHRATITERGQGKDVVDGEIQTACQQACPTQAIIFGNLMDPTARVTRLQGDVRAYSILQQELNTRPRTRYLAKVSNPTAQAGNIEQTTESGTA